MPFEVITLGTNNGWPRVRHAQQRKPVVEWPNLLANWLKTGNWRSEYLNVCILWNEGLALLPNVVAREKTRAFKSCESSEYQMGKADGGKGKRQRMMSACIEANPCGWICAWT